MMAMKVLLDKGLRYLFTIGLAVGSGILFLPNAARADASSPFIGEISCGGWNFCPLNWEDCAGQLLPIVQYEALFNLIGTTYGGDGQTTFALPNIAGRTMVHQGQGTNLSNYTIGQTGGTETVTLTTAQIPAHNHTVVSHTGSEKSASPTSKIPGNATSPVYAPSTTDSIPLAAGTVGTTGGSQPHNNLQPYLTIKCCISLFGIFPSQN